MNIFNIKTTILILSFYTFVAILNETHLGTGLIEPDNNLYGILLISVVIFTPISC